MAGQHHQLLIKSVDNDVHPVVGIVIIIFIIVAQIVQLLNQCH